MIQIDRLRESCDLGTGCTYIQRKIRLDRDMYIASSVYYRRMSLLLSIPSIIITTMISTGSILLTSSKIETYVHDYVNISMALMGTLSVLLQSLQNAFEWNIKASKFRAVGEQYDQLCTRITFEIIEPNESNFIQEIEKDILDIKKSCPFFPPLHIVKYYQSLS